MKKPDREHLLYLDAVWRRRHAKLAHKSAVRRRKALRLFESRKRSHAHKNIRVYTPIELSILNQARRNELAALLDHIKDLLRDKARVTISFDRTKTLTVGGTLFFVASIERLLALYPGQITCGYPTDPIVEQMLQHIGLLSKLGNSPRTTITAENVKHWHYLQGRSTDLSGVKNLFEILSTQLSNDTTSGLFDSISEAITNVVHWAYEGVKDEAIASGPRWWLFAQLKDDKLDIAICDLGIGIPKSLRDKPELATVLPNLIRRMRKRVASGMIEIAVESSKSRTRLPHRGKGLPDMLIFSKLGNVGGFLIFSHHGYFVYNADFASETARDFAPPINGTVVQFQIPLVDSQRTKI